VRLDSEEVAVCFPPQTAPKEQALIACFNRYERNHPGHAAWPEDNLGACRWDGLTVVPTPYGLAFGDVTAVPAVPRAGQPFVLEVGITGGDAAGKKVNAAIETGALAAGVTLGGVNNGIPLDFEYGFHADGKIHVTLTLPRTAQGKRLTIKLTIGADTPTGTKVVPFTVGR
jgi:hypothetical protein